MKQIIGYLKLFYKEHLNIYDVLFAFVYVAGFTYLNYFTPFISEIKNANLWKTSIIPFYFILYGTPFLIGYLFSSVNHKDYGFLKNPKFWFLFCFALTLFVLRSSSHIFADPLWQKIRFWDNSLWYYSLIMTIIRGIFIFIPCLILWRFSADFKKPFYGFTLKNFSTKPYFGMLLIMLPLVILASTQVDFLGAYPRGARFSELSITNPDHRWYYIIYELFYGSDFFSIEFFFRGFLILGLLEVAGPRVLLPMALFYVTIHFGKPAGELVSSLFGGSILGIVAYYSRSIVGGIIVHVGTAWLMELGALIGNIYK